MNIRTSSLAVTQNYLFASTSHVSCHSFCRSRSHDAHISVCMGTSSCHLLSLHPCGRLEKSPLHSPRARSRRPRESPSRLKKKSGWPSKRQRVGRCKKQNSMPKTMELRMTPCGSKIRAMSFSRKETTRERSTHTQREVHVPHLYQRSGFVASHLRYTVYLHAERFQ